MLKECRTCGVIKPTVSFYKNFRMKDGRLNECNECRSAKDKIYTQATFERRRENYLAKREQLATKRKTSYDNSHVKIRRMVQAIKAKCKQRGIPFDLTPEDLTVPELCRYLQVPLEYNAVGSVQQNSATLDRIDPAQGYVRGNVEIISHLANGMKNSATLEQLKVFAASVLAH